MFTTEFAKVCFQPGFMALVKFGPNAAYDCSFVDVCLDKCLTLLLKYGTFTKKYALSLVLLIGLLLYNLKIFRRCSFLTFFVGVRL